MLDLTKIKRYYELKWFDGTVLHLPLPTQEMLVKVMNVDELEDVEEQLDALTALLKEILAKNIDGKVFKEEDYAELDLYVVQAIMEDYVEYINQQLGE